jgi:hypothetical protein
VAERRNPNDAVFGQVQDKDSPRLPAALPVLSEGRGVADGRAIRRLAYRANRDVLEVRARGDPIIPLAVVFTMRSLHLPNPLGCIA